MKILTITCVSDRSEVALYKGLAGRGIEVINFCDPRDTAFQDLNDHKVKTSALPIRHRFDFQSTRAIKDITSKQSFSCIYCPTSRGLASCLRATKGSTLPLVSYRGTMGHLHPWNPVDRLAHLNKRVSKIVANCNAVKDFLVSVGIPEKNLAVVYKGHDANWYTPTNTQIKLPTRPDSFVIACVAKIRPLKGVNYLIEALDLLIKDQLNAELVLIGELCDPQLPKLVKSLGLEDRVHFLGHKKDVSNYISKANVSVMPSIEREGVARAIIESLSLSIPVIVSDTGGLPETVIDNESGLIVPARSTQALYEKLRFLIDNKDRAISIGAAGKKRFLECFDLDNYVDSMIKVFESVI